MASGWMTTINKRPGWAMRTYLITAERTLMHMTMKRTMNTGFRACCALVFIINWQTAYSDGEEKLDSRQVWIELADKLIEPSMDFLKDRKSIEANKKEVEKLLESQSNDAFYWYLHGKLIEAGLSAYYFENKDTKFKEMGGFHKDEYVIAQRKVKYAAYEKAVNLNLSSAPEDKLSYRMLDNVAFDLGAPYQTRVQALRQIMAMPVRDIPRHPDGDVHGDMNGDHVFLIYKSIVGTYLDGKDFDGALSVLGEMQEKYPYLKDELAQAVSDVLAQKQDRLRQIPSADFRQSIEIDSKYSGVDLFSNIADDPSKRESLLNSAWGIATSNSPVENRVYLFALAIDLYNSLPPGKDPAGYNPGEITGKGDKMNEIQGSLFYRGGSPQEAWLRAVERNSELGKELAYIKYYLRERARLDHFSEPASLDPARLDLLNPTHYAGLKAFMDENRAALERDIPPWGAESFTAQAAMKSHNESSGKQNATSSTLKYDIAGSILIFGLFMAGYIVFWRR
jgi:hypothetical protein